jgi:hypothetical protein
MQNFFVGVLVKLLSDEKIQAFLIVAAKRIVGDAITGKILDALPEMFAGMLDTAIKQIPGIDNIQNVKHVADAGREILNSIIPDLDTGFKPLDDLMDIWRPKNG